MVARASATHPYTRQVRPAIERLRRRIREDGPVSFASFMEAALYGEGGYYARESLAIGRDGDFVTGASFSPLFGRATATLMRRLDEAIEGGVMLLEAGYGTGAHLAAVAGALAGSETIGIAGWDRVARTLPSGEGPPTVSRLGSLDEVPPGEVHGLVFSYELFDAMPFHRLVGRGPEGTVGELWVGLDEEGGFRWVEGELSRDGLAELLGGASLGPGQIADLSPDWVPLYRALAERLGRGLLVTCDYGFERSALLDARIRPHGTLACYRHQRVHRDPFVSVGEQDLSCHVDFTALRTAGEEAGLATVTLTRQARWLMACGLFDGLADARPAERVEAMTLLDPAGMGEEIRVLVQARDIDVGALLNGEILG